MVDISAAITSAQQTINNSSDSSATSSKTVADNYDTFLSLLTTQLKNQDPMDPVDTDQFTQQLIQYSEVEQLLQSNKNLESLLELASANTSMSVINYVGKEITSKGDTTSLADGKANWSLDVPTEARNVTYVVKDANGNEVYSTTGTLNTGSSNFIWDGTNSTGGTAAPGKYNLTVTAKDVNDNPLTIGISTKGVVDGVDMTGDAPILLVNGTRYKISDVSEIHTVN
jgi:flagellar basal-body rod modification protein FlgD